MFPTVSEQPLRQDRSSEKEKVQLANGCRDAANLTSRTRVQATTKGTGAFTTVWTSETMPEGAAWIVNASALGRGPAARCLIGTTALYFREPAGVTTQAGLYADPAIASPAALTAAFATSGNKILVQVKDDGATTIDWDVLMTLREVK